MKSRDNMSVVIAGLQKEHGLLAAFLEAADKVDWRALHKQVVISETPESAHAEAQQIVALPPLPKVVPAISFTFRRANLVRAGRE